MHSKGSQLIALLAIIQLGVAGVHAQTHHPEAEEAARQSLETFIEAWNTADNAKLRQAMNFPFVTLAGGGATTIAERPEDFSIDFESMRDEQDWARSSFDFETFEVTKSSPEKVHCAIDFHRYKADGSRYLKGRVMYIVTKHDGHWAPQLRSPLVTRTPLSASDKAAALEGARQAVLDFFTAFNNADADATTRHLNYPHVFMTRGGGLAVAEDSASRSVRPDFESMRASQDWHFSTIESLEASHVTRDKVHMELVFSRWHPDGTRYWTVPALWIMTRVDRHWGIQLRSLMPATFSDLTD